MKSNTLVLNNAPVPVALTRFNMKTLQMLVVLLVALAVEPLARAQSWNGGDIHNGNLNWSDANNWTGGVPITSSAVSFPDGAWPVTTNVQGDVNNIVQSSTAILSLTYNNSINDFVATEIPSGAALTVSGGITLATGSSVTVVTMSGGGSLIGGSSGGQTLGIPSVSTSTAGTSLLDLSGLSTFVFNVPGGTGSINLGTTAGGRGQLNLASVSNNLSATTLNLGNNNTSGLGTLNLGNGTNIINVDTINMGESKTTGTMQFLNNAGGGVTIANHTGTGRTTINLATEGSSGSTSTDSTGKMLFNGGTVNILAGTVTMANRVARADSPGATAVLSFSNGIVDATTINMAINTSGGGSSFGTLSVGGGTLKIGSGGMSMVNQGGTAGAGMLIVTNGATVVCSNNIYKTTANGVASLILSGGNLIMTSPSGTIGVEDGNPIDNFDLTNSTVTLSAALTADVVVANFDPDTATSSTINVGTLPNITVYPTQLPLISYATAGGNVSLGGNANLNLVLGSLPPSFPIAFTGYLSNNTANNSIDLVITNGPKAKEDEWGGGVNNNWDTTSFNWTNNGVAVTYNDLDFVTFDDLARATNVNITATRKPGSLTVNNSVLDYAFSGAGSLSSPFGAQLSLLKEGSASLTLAESGGDNFSGGITNDGGTLVLDDAGSAISGGLVIANGTTVQIGNNDDNGALPSGTLDDEGLLVFDHANNVLVSTVIPGGGALAQIGTGILALSTTNTYSGSTTVANGTLALTNTGSIADSQGVLVTNATLDVSGASAATTLTSLSLGNATLNVGVGYLATNFTVGNLTLGGTSNTINVLSLPPIANYPASVTLLQTGGSFSGYNFVLGALPSASPPYTGASLAQSGDGTAVVLTLTGGPIGTRPSVTWTGADYLDNVNTNWSDPQNWLTPGAPSAGEKVMFNDNGAAGGTPFDQTGDGAGGIQNPANVNNIVNTSLTNAALTYANAGGTYHNTLITSGNTLTENGSLAVDGTGGVVTILGSNAVLQVNNPSNSTTINVENGSSPTLDMSGLGTFKAAVNQIGVGFDIASTGTLASGSLYLARTNTVTTAAGSSSVNAALVVGGGGLSSANTSATGQLYLGQTNALYVDGILLGVGTSASAGSIITFNPTWSNNPVAYIRGILGDSSRVTQWALGDDTVNLNNDATPYGFVCDFSEGTLNALVNTLIVGHGAHGNEAETQTVGTFNMGAGILDVTTLDIGFGGVGVAGAGIGVMNVTNGTLVVNALGLGVAGDGGGLPTTTGTLNLNNALLVVSNSIVTGAGTGGGDLNATNSTIELLDGATAELTALNLSGGTLQLNADANAGVAIIQALTVGTNLSTRVNISSLTNVSATVQIPLISYTGNDPYGALSLGTFPAGYTVALVDNAGNGSVDLSVTVSALPPSPGISSISVSGTTLSISATNGAINAQVMLLGTTNLATPLADWTRILTTNFDGGGNLSLSTNVISPASHQEFYILAQPQ
jgi:hypothetical protein